METKTRGGRRGFMKHLSIILILLMPVLAEAQTNGHTPTPEEIHKMQQDPEAYIAILEDPQRDVEQKPDEVIAAMHIRKGETIADIGAGSGYFAFRFAPHVGASGRIYAVDINPDMILYMNRIIRDKKIGNVTTVLSTPDDPLLPPDSIDRFFICNTWHHIPDPSRYLGLMKEMLRPGGQIVIVDYFKKALPAGPPPSMKIARGEVVDRMKKNGFGLAEEHTFLPYQYFLVFKKE